LSVTGFDDVRVASMIWPELTTIRQPISAMARLAADMLIENSPRRSLPAPSPRHVLEHQLIVRSSTAPPRS
jgi:LacI family transcriptional regulator